MQELENNLMEYFNGNLPTADRVKIEEWAALSDANTTLFAQVKRLHELTEDQDEAFNANVDQAWEKVQSRLFSEPKGKQVFLSLKYVYRVAAVLIFALSIGVLSYVVSNDDLTTMASATGETQEIELPDGTKIILNEESKLSYDIDFDDDKRIVHLDGQAFFDVARDEQRPFTIIGKSASISVLGTSFDFISKSEFAEVNVRSGKVSFKNNFGKKSELILTKNQQGKLSDNKLVMLDELDREAMAWRFDELIFKSTRLVEVISKLSKYYEVEFEIDATIENCLITTSFQDQSLDQVLNVLEVIANIKNERNGNVIKLIGPGC